MTLVPQVGTFAPEVPNVTSVLLDERLREGSVVVAPQCPIRLGEACSLCVPGASGPADCGLVYLVMSDPELREGLHRLRVAAAGRARTR